MKIANGNEWVDRRLKLGSARANSGVRRVRTATIGQRASILQCLYCPIENALGVVKIEQDKIGERIRLSDFDPLTNLILVFRPQTVQSLIKFDSKLRS